MHTSNGGNLSFRPNSLIFVALSGHAANPFDPAAVVVLALSTSVVSASHGAPSNVLGTQHRHHASKRSTARATKTSHRFFAGADLAFGGGRWQGEEFAEQGILVFCLEVVHLGVGLEGDVGLGVDFGLGVFLLGWV